MISLQEKKPRGRPKKNQSEVNLKPTFSCDFCKKNFLSEKVHLNHTCEAKRRVLQRDDRSVAIGFHSYQRFWACRMNPKHKQTWEDFEKTSLYTAFVRFGRYVRSVNAINPIGFVEFLIRGEVGIDDWCKESCYQLYVRELNKLETPLEALQRTMLLMEEWAFEHSTHWTDFFRGVSTPQAVLWILNGRISPWILLTASSAHELLSRLDTRQVEIVTSVIDEKFWEIKISRHQTEVTDIMSVLAAHNV